MKGENPGQGQSKLHKIRNESTGEEREVTQTEWREQGKSLREQGFVRVDEDGTEPADPTVEGGQ
jgi:hypothetical protein